jgi:alkylation response protein AidB-like acyl-CoA dehydrogenase
MVIAKSEVEMVKLLIARAAEVFDNGAAADERLMYAAIAKAQATEAALAAVDIAIQAHGGSGFDRDNGLITLWPLILMSRLVPLCNSTIWETFAEQEYGLPPSP